MDNIDFTNANKVDVSRNQLTSIPNIPNLKILICYKNKLSSIPPSTTLGVLECQENNITHMNLEDFPSLKQLTVDSQVHFVDGLSDFFNRDIKIWFKKV